MLHPICCGDAALRKLSAISYQRSGNKSKAGASPAPKKPLSPIIPVHPGNSLVSLIIPVHTSKQGGGALKKLSATSDQRSGCKKKPVLSPDFSGSPLATRHSLARRSFSGGGPLATNSNHFRTIGNCGLTSRTRFNMYHYITYLCRGADNFIHAHDTKEPKSGPPQKDGPYTRRRHPRKGARFGKRPLQRQEEPRRTRKDACATKPRRKPREEEAKRGWGAGRATISRL